MLARQQQAVSQQAGAAVEGALSRDTRQLRKIIIFR